MWPNWRRGPEQARVFISRIRRDDKIIEPDPDTVIREGDVIAVLTRSELLTARGAEIGAEVSDKELLDFPIEFLDVVITNKSFVGKSMTDLAAMDFARGVFLKKVTRVGQTMPFSPADAGGAGRRNDSRWSYERRRAGRQEPRLRRPRDGDDGHDLRRARAFSSAAW